MSSQKIGFVVENSFFEYMASVNVDEKIIICSTLCFYSQVEKMVKEWKLTEMILYSKQDKKNFTIFSILDLIQIDYNENIFFKEKFEFIIELPNFVHNFIL